MSGKQEIARAGQRFARRRHALARANVFHQWGTWARVVVHDFLATRRQLHLVAESSEVLPVVKGLALNGLGG